ncbi:unnamed protein product, partial [Callosobruchus maculatus]
MVDFNRQRNGESYVNKDECSKSKDPNLLSSSDNRGSINNLNVPSCLLFKYISHNIRFSVPLSVEINHRLNGTDDRNRQTGAEIIRGGRPTLGIHCHLKTHNSFQRTSVAVGFGRPTPLGNR